MHIITDAAALARALDSPLPSAVKRLLALRADLIDLATFIVPEPGDGLAQVEAAAGIPLASNIVDGSSWGKSDFEPSFEWASDHGGAFELPFILSDDGSSIVLIVPDDDRVDATLLAIARHYAEPAAAMTDPIDPEGQPLVR